MTEFETGGHIEHHEVLTSLPEGEKVACDEAGVAGQKNGHRTYAQYGRKRVIVLKNRHSPKSDSISRSLCARPYSFDGDSLGEITWLGHVGSLDHRRMIR